MSDVVEDLRLLQEGAQWARGETAATLGEAADEIVQLRGTLRRALRLYEIEQAERPTPNEPIWVKLARQLLDRRDGDAGDDPDVIETIANRLHQLERDIIEAIGEPTVMVRLPGGHLVQKRFLDIYKKGANHD